jgi:hypothetical protein
MNCQDIQDLLLLTLARCYEEDPRRFVTLSRQILDSSSARVAVAELRNGGFLEERLRGVVRLTIRGYQKYLTTLTCALPGPNPCEFLKCGQSQHLSAGH